MRTRTRTRTRQAVQQFSQVFQLHAVARGGARRSRTIDDVLQDHNVNCPFFLCENQSDLDGVHY